MRNTAKRPIGEVPKFPLFLNGSKQRLRGAISDTGKMYNSGKNSSCPMHFTLALNTSTARRMYSSLTLCGSNFGKINF